MSVVTYNGVELPYAFITDFKQEAVYDDSNTDWYCTKFDISVQTIINSSYLSKLAPTLVAGGNPVTTNPADIMVAVRSLLLKPRRILSVKFNGVELIPQPQAGINVLRAGFGIIPSQYSRYDVQNGPHPQSCAISSLSNTTFLLTYHIIAHYWENNKVTPNGNPINTNKRSNNVLTNRWTETVELDDCLYSTRTRSGKMIMRTDNADLNTVDDLRSDMVVIGVPNGFLRKSSKYSVSPNGLELTYDIVDQEVYKLPPAGALRAEGYYREKTIKLGGWKVGDCRVKLKGPKNIGQFTLLDRALEICARKLFIRALLITGKKKGASVPYETEMNVNMYDNEVEVRMVAGFKPFGDVKDIAGRFKGIPGVSSIGLCNTPLSDDDDGKTLPHYTDRGTADLLLRAANFYDPSIVTTKMNPKTGNFDDQLAEIGNGLGEP